MIDRGNKEPFQFKDLFDIDDIFKRKGGQAFEAKMKSLKEKKKSKLGFFVFMMNQVGQYAWTGGLLFVAVGLIQILMPIYLRWLLNWFEAPEGTESRWKGYYYSAVLCLTLLVRSFFSSSGISLLHKGCVLIGNYMGFLIG